MAITSFNGLLPDERTRRAQAALRGRLPRRREASSRAGEGSLAVGTEFVAAPLYAWRTRASRVGSAHAEAHSVGSPVDRRRPCRGRLAAHREPGLELREPARDEE